MPHEFANQIYVRRLRIFLESTEKLKGMTALLFQVPYANINGGTSSNFIQPDAEII